MEDKLILKLAEETVSILADMEFHEPCDKVGASYNALLAAAKKNHPDDTFLAAMLPVEGGMEGGKHQLQILFTQLRIVMDALQQAAANASKPGATPGTTSGSA